MNKPVAELMHREMTRKEFLLTLGLGLASVAGLSGLINMLTGKSFETHVHKHINAAAPAAPASYGYGHSPYGR